MENISSKLLENGVNEFAKLPGIGKKTALRLALHLLNQSPEEVEKFGNTLIRMKTDLIYCKRCHNISDTEICDICNSPQRNKHIICIVSDIRDVLAVENTRFFNGVYHVLGGLISPMDGVSPSMLNIHNIAERISNEGITEIIFALPATPEGDTTAFYISKQVQNINVLITCIARGIAIGDDLEFTDEVTLGKSIMNRLPFGIKKELN